MQTLLANIDEQCLKVIQNKHWCQRMKKIYCNQSLWWFDYRHTVVKQTKIMILQCLQFGRIYVKCFVSVILLCPFLILLMWVYLKSSLTLPFSGQSTIGIIICEDRILVFFRNNSWVSSFNFNLENRIQPHIHRNLDPRF